MDNKTTDTGTPYILDYRNVKHPRLEYKTGTLLLILPKHYKNEKQTLEKYKQWIQRKELAIKKALEETQTKAINRDRTDKQIKELVQTLAQNYQAELSTKINKIHFKKMKTKWASYSRNKNLTINTLIRYLPQDVIEYILYHEICHSIERKHNNNFWNLVNGKFRNYPTKEKDLLTYWFLIQKTTPNSTSSQN